MKPIIKPKKGMNKTEQRYSHQLEMLKLSGKIIDYRYEELTFILASNTKYTPDFVIIYPDNITITEIKGYLRDDASIKFKIAQKQWPWFKWQMLRWDKKKKEWKKVRI